MPAPKKPKSAKKRGGTPPSKVRQRSSAHAIMRERYKALAIEFRLQEFSLRAIAEAINEHYTAGEGVDELPPRFKFKRISAHLVQTLVDEAIKEGVDPLKKEMLAELEIQRTRKLLSAVMQAALQGSIAHVQAAQSLQRDLRKMLGLDEKDGDGGGGPGITQIFLNGKLAEV